MEIDASARDAIKFAKEFPDRFARALMPAADKMGFAIAEKVVETQFTGDPLNTRTGMLRASIKHRVQKVGNSIVISVGVLRGPAAKYAQTQEEGRTIRPTSAKFLAIPLKAALTGSGRPRFPLGPRDPNVKRHYPGGTFLLKRPGRNPIIMGMRIVAGGGTRRTPPVPLFALVKSVRIIATNFLSEGVLMHLDTGQRVFDMEMDRLLFAA